jgi:hypothetical protein
MKSLRQIAGAERGALQLQGTETQGRILNMKQSWRFGTAVAVIGFVGLAACGSSSKSGTGSTPTTTAAETTTTAAPEPTTTTSPPSPYKATGEPTTGLAAGAAVKVSVSNFKAGLTLGINECAQQGTADVGAEDCDLGGIKTLTVAADGTGTGTIKVKDKAIGSNAHDCHAADTRCFLSVGELTADPNAQRSDDINLTFG